MLLGNSAMPLLQQGFILPMLVLKPEKEGFILIQDIIKDCAKHVVMIGLTFTLPVTVKKLAMIAFSDLAAGSRSRR